VNKAQERKTQSSDSTKTKAQQSSCPKEAALLRLGAGVQRSSVSRQNPDAWVAILCSLGFSRFAVSSVK